MLHRGFSKGEKELMSEIFTGCKEILIEICDFKRKVGSNESLDKTATSPRCLIRRR
jgi:hypothetical protein